ncbi:hypothetical protein H072_11452 [Dactylellina haptotyla CBS 200.50]|uniref:NF-X1-type domain-containing protein n=1 Tax=Dactylellina haptotyla (strain CBS 200.50) TaxID=1284197 RepID=S7ZWI4_DACHA|nr:hypothetical protein H072_11452 [Dactylellina haptotyla CBS 200.50]
MAAEINRNRRPNRGAEPGPSPSQHNTPPPIGQARGQVQQTKGHWNGRNSRKGKQTQSGASDVPRGPQTGQTPHRNFQNQNRANNSIHQSAFRDRFATQKEELSVAALQEFLNTGVERMGASSDSKQAFIEQLATEQGLQRVRQLLESEYSTTPYSVSKPSFSTHCISFLRILSDERAVGTLSLEQKIGTIYNVVYGINGKRAIFFFENVLQCLTVLKPKTDADDDAACMAPDDWMDSIRMATKVFLNTLRMNQSATLQAQMQQIGKSFAEIHLIYDSVPTNIKEAIGENILGIETILFAGAEVPETKPQSKQNQRPEKDEPIDFPGQLSHAGPRHDNDHELITEISILPTVSEIICDGRKEFLPTRMAYEDADHHHQHGIQRLVDIQFRLLREDTSGQLRNSCRFILKHWEEVITPATKPGDWQAKRKLIREGCTTPIRLYFDISIQKLGFDTKGLEAIVEFEQPRSVRSSTLVNRQRWWRKSMELRENKAVVALIDKTQDEANILFFVVSGRIVTSSDEQSDARSQQTQNYPMVDDLSTDSRRACITLRLVTFENPGDQARLMNLAIRYSHFGWQEGLLMLEFPTVIYKHYEGILRCLKFIHQNPEKLPFSKWLAPRIKGSSGGEDTAFEIPPPEYLNGNFLNLSSCLTLSAGERNGAAVTNNVFALSPQANSESLAKELANRSSLDHGQAKAFISAFKHQIALTQGPPGCGKSYVGVKMVTALLENRDQLKLGPILCVCYTNHALDQFLNELLKMGVKKIRRIGSPSPLPQIEELSFDNYKRVTPKPRIAGFAQRITAVRRSTDDLKHRITMVCSELEVSRIEMVTAYLGASFPGKLQEIIIGANLYGFDEASGKPAEAIEMWMGDSNMLAGEDGNSQSVDELFLLPVWGLSYVQRATVFRHWHQASVDRLTQRLQDLIVQYSMEKEALTNLYLRSDKILLEDTNILGITTVGLVNNADLVRTLPARVMVCEEAGEVLESHVLTALLPSLQQVILIGDHLQLRPKISNLRLSKEYTRGSEETGKYNLDESLFERLANMKVNIGDNDVPKLAKVFPIGQLDIQRRMHPSISNLVRKTLYPELHDHETTKTYPEVAGIKRRLFWLDHKNHEDPSDPSDAMGLSKTNCWEVRMVVSLVTYIARQGVYKAGEIAVLTPYVSQLRKLMESFESVMDYEISERDLEELDPPDEGESDRPKSKNNMKKSKILDRIRIATVDNFQGEEASVVIISLVRSNDKNNCGFLKTPNRINVLLSRAKHGMYIIGNATTSVHVPMWKEVISLLEDSQNIGPKLQLSCPRHPNKKTFVKCPEDFEDQCPEGGCSEKCDLRLPCGHTCEVKCHPKLLHDNAFCFKTCTKPRSCGHACRQQCKDPCGNCTEKVFKIELPCGHIAAEMPCYMQNNLKHHPCQHIVPKVIPECNHTVEISCFLAQTTTPKCTHKCEATLPCEHICQRRCAECTGTGSHRSCSSICGKGYSECRHECTQVCHSGRDCLPCSKPCEIRCKHGKCLNKCGEACVPCAEECKWECAHQEQKCNMPCAVPCDKLPCDKRCDELLKKCKHRCPSVCGEECPSSDYCQECGKPDIKSKRVDLIEMTEYAAIDLDTDPIIVLDCGHFYTISNLDGLLELEKYYRKDGTDETKKVEFKACPDCRRPLRHINRYNRVFKTVLLDILTERFVKRSVTEFTRLLEALRLWESTNRKLRAIFLDTLVKTPAEGYKRILDNYKRNGKKLLQTIQRFNRSVMKAEQPFSKVHDLYISAVARRGNSDDNDDDNQTFTFDETKIQTGLAFKGKCLEFRAKWVLYWDWHTISTDDNVQMNVKGALRDTLATELKNSIVESTTVRKECEKAEKLLVYELEARIFHTMLSVLEVQNDRARDFATDPLVVAKMMTQEMRSLELCERFVHKHPGTLGRFRGEILEANRLLHELGATPNSTIEDNI